MYFEVPDSTPTPAPYVVSSSDTEVDAADSNDGLGGASSTTISRSTSLTDDFAYSGLIDDDAATSDESDSGGGASSSSAAGTVPTGTGTVSGPLPWTFTVIAVGAINSMLSRAAGLFRA